MYSSCSFNWVPNSPQQMYFKINITSQQIPASPVAGVSRQYAIRNSAVWPCICIVSTHTPNFVRLQSVFSHVERVAGVKHWSVIILIHDVNQHRRCSAQRLASCEFPVLGLNRQVVHKSGFSIQGSGRGDLTRYLRNENKRAVRGEHRGYEAI